MIKILRAKLHGIRVTGAALDYHGSISLDPLICKRAGILPTEFVEIWNKNSGARITTYVIYGAPGSNCCILNGAAARTCQIGDEIIIAAVEYVDRRHLAGKTQTVLTFHSDNRLHSTITYRTIDDGADGYNFSIEESVT